MSGRDSLDQLIITARFVDANPNPEILADGKMEYKCNYFLGNDPAKWHTDVPNYEAVTLKDLYPGIDLKLSSDLNNQATYEFIAAPNAGGDVIPLLRGVRGVSSSHIKVTYEGTENTSFDSDGRTILQTKWGNMLAALDPLANTAGFVSPRFAADEGKIPSITGETQSLSGTKSGTLELAYSTYLGGGRSDYGQGIAVDGSGNAYVTGYTFSANFPTLNPVQTSECNANYPDAFVSKFSHSGNSLIYSTYLGGEYDDVGYAIAVDEGGAAYVAGMTVSTNFPTLNSYQTNQGCGDVFAAKLSVSGSIIYSTYLGGNMDDFGYGIAIDDNGSAFVTGYTLSPDFPTKGPYQSYQGRRNYSDAFVTKLSVSGDSLIYSTYLGAGEDEVGKGIAVDCNCSAYVTGCTWSSDFPTLNPYQSHRGMWSDAFVTKLSSSGDALIYSTYLGGNGRDCGNGIAVDGSGNAYVAGQTLSTNFPTLNAYQSTFHGNYWDSDAFVTKLNGSGSSLIFSTYLGGAAADEGLSVAVDSKGCGYVAGCGSDDFPTLNAYQTGGGPYVSKFSGSGVMIYSTCFGTGFANAMAVDNVGSVYVTGAAGPDFPMLNPFQFYGGGVDAFVSKFTFTPNYPCGDANTDETVDLLDVVFLINYIFAGGPAPQELPLGDVDCNGSINIADAVRLIIYLFSSGPAPCSDCP